MRRPAVSPASLLAAVYLAALLVCVLAAGLISPFDPLEQAVERRLEPPGRVHLFGTDGSGRDVWSRTLHGARTSLAVAAAAVALAGFAGVATGLASAWAGGTVDLVVQRLVDLLLGFPFLVTALVIIVALSPSWWVVSLAIALSLFPQVTRVARAAALSVANEEYLTTVHSTGAGFTRIVFRHLLPAASPAIVAYLATSLAAAVAAEATLGFLGLGVPPPFPSWGRLLQEGSRAYFDAAPWVTLLPGAVLSLTVLCLMVVGEGVGRRRAHAAS